MTDPRTPQRASFFARLPLASSVFAQVFGMAVLAGWAFQVRVLKTIFPGQVAVKANTALCFVLIGFALWLVRTEDPHRSCRRRWVSGALGGIVAIIGLLSFLEYCYDWSPGIDQFLFSAGLEDLPGSVRPGLMSPLTAVGFSLLGPAIILLEIRSRWSQVLQQIFSGVVAIVALVGMLDFALAAEKSHTHISPGTALVLFLLVAGVAAARAEWAWVDF